MTDFLKNQLEIVTEWGIAKCFSRYNESCQVVHIDEKIGSGFFETCNFERCQLSKVNCTFYDDKCVTNNNADSKFTVYFVLQGDFTYIKDDVSYSVSAPALYLLKGNFGSVSAEISKNSLINEMQITVNEKYIDILSHQLNNTDNKAMCHNNLLWYFSEQQENVVQLPLSNATQKIMQEAWELFSLPTPQDEISLMQLQGSTLSFLVSVLTCNYHELFELDNEIPSYVLQTKLLLDNFYHENWTITEIAKKVATNECYLKKQFKQFTGQSIHQYRLNKRMLQASHMLNNNIPTTDIARQLGFASHHYFLKVFEKFQQNNQA